MEASQIEGERKAAIVLAAGQGVRMRADMPKQYLLLDGKPILYYSLQAFEDSEVDEVVLVVGKGEEEYCQKEIVEKYGLQKVSKIIQGGKERSDSVFAGLLALEGLEQQRNSYVFIHDAARPFLTPKLIAKLLQEVRACKACVAGMPVKDTIKIADEQGNVAATPERKRVWQIQTPQVFSYPLILGAYRKLFDGSGIQVTDDAMVLERMEGHPVRLVEAYYQNIKITTPEDIAIAQAFREMGNEK